MDNEINTFNELLETYYGFEEEDQKKMYATMNTVVPHPRIITFEKPHKDSEKS